MVGALARCNINFDQLNDEAKGVAKAIGFKVPCYNSFMNTAAQLVEMAHCTYDSVRIIDHFLENGVDYNDIVTSWPTTDEWKNLKVNAGRGVGAVEVPRGMLVHDYTYDKSGRCVEANCVIPTNQNHANIQLDMESFVPQILDKEEDEIRLLLEMLVRAYDPCISCSTHYLDIEFKE
jgi:coenzyme F420-reducing hydrogenase alpha subunit